MVARITIIGLTAAVATCLSWLMFALDMRALGLRDAASIRVVRALDTRTATPSYFSHYVAAQLLQSVATLEPPQRIGIFSIGTLSVQSAVTKTEQLAVVAVSEGFFDAMPVLMADGRRDVRFDESGCSVVASESVMGRWRGAAQGAANSRVSIGSHSCEISGVVAAGASFPDARVEFWVPLELWRAVRPTAFQPGIRSFGAVVAAATDESLATIAEVADETGDRIRLRAEALPEFIHGRRVVTVMKAARVAVIGVLICGAIAILYSAIAFVVSKSRELEIMAALGAPLLAVCRWAVWPRALVDSLISVCVGLVATFAIAGSLTLFNVGVPSDGSAWSAWAAVAGVFVTSILLLVAIEVCGLAGAALLSATRSASNSAMRRYPRMTIVELGAWGVGIYICVAASVFASVALVKAVGSFRQVVPIDWRHLVVVELPNRGDGPYQTLWSVKRELADVAMVRKIGVVSHLPFEHRPNSTSILYGQRRVMNGDQTSFAQAPSVLYFAGDAVAAMGLASDSDDTWSVAPVERAPVCFVNKATMNLATADQHVVTELAFPGPLRKGQSSVEFRCSLRGVLPDVPFAGSSLPTVPQLTMQFRDKIGLARFAVAQVELEANQAAGLLSSRLAALNPIRIWTGRSLYERYFAAEILWSQGSLIASLWSISLALIVAYSVIGARAEVVQRTVAVVLALGGSRLQAAALSTKKLIATALISSCAGLATALVMAGVFLGTGGVSVVVAALISLALAAGLIAAVAAVAWNNVSRSISSVDLLRV